MNLSEYIKTPEWRKKRLETFLKKWKKCMKCWSEKQIQVHHSNYSRLWNEDIEIDLFPLCTRCHNFFHKKYEWHFIENTLEFISIKELPKYKPSKIAKNNPNSKKKKRWRKTLEERIKDRKSRVKKVKEPFVSTTYKATQWKEYKYNNFKL
jgi:hypothetical protein